MNKKAIGKTAVCRWDVEDECFIVQSPLFDSLVAAGDTEAGARAEYLDMLDDTYEAYLEGLVPNARPGRPAKNGLALNTDVKPDTKQTIVRLASEIDCSQGEVIDFVVAFYQANQTLIQEVLHRDCGGRSIASVTGLSRTTAQSPSRSNVQSAVREPSNAYLASPAEMYGTIKAMEKRLKRLEAQVHLLQMREP